MQNPVIRFNLVENCLSMSRLENPEIQRTRYPCCWLQGKIGLFHFRRLSCLTKIFKFRSDTLNISPLKSSIRYWKNSVTSSNKSFIKSYAQYIVKTNVEYGIWRNNGRFKNDILGLIIYLHHLSRRDTPIHRGTGCK